MSNVKRIYVEKKASYAVKEKELKDEIINYLGIKNLVKVRILNRYDIENISEEIYIESLSTIFYEPPVDNLYEEKFPYEKADKIFSVEFLPGQFDQRADSAVQCVKLLNEKEEVVIRSGVTYVLSGELTDDEFKKIKAYCINPVDSIETDEMKPETLITDFEDPKDITVFDDFIYCKEEKLKELYESLGLAMTFADFLHIQTYFKEEHRNPTMTEIRVFDTYWSDHCRHTTFLTELKNVEFENGFYTGPMKDSYERYLKDREVIYQGREDKYISLMDIALMAMKKLRADGKLEDMEVSDEINACSIIVPVEIDGKEEEWLVFFKNETHNHPTEIEPFGGAATCLGGAIRDPLSGRGYVYQAMRITGGADPRVSLKDTLKGKLPQRKIVTESASGYSSYGNQIGLATGLVEEIYHPGYVAKRMEIGAVVGGAPRKNVIREKPQPGDIIILLGGRTGRDGCGGATGSSKAHTESSIKMCGAEVQKGNAPTERKIQRLFKREEVSSMIKKCNDFGAGGVSVAIGELADGLHIYLDKVPKKYAGLDGTELAISESQERMAVVVDKKYVSQFLTFAREENLEAVEVAKVTKEARLVMLWRGEEIVNISRRFLDTNGAHQEAAALVTMPKVEDNYFKQESSETELKSRWLSNLRDLNVCSQKGLVEMFDSSIGSGTVTMPYGGKYQLTKNQTMVAKLPVLRGKCNTVTIMSYGFDPYLSSWSPYHGAIYAIISSVAKIVASGGNYESIRFTFQEYFKRLGEDKRNWGEPLAALLGAYDAQMKLGLPSIGGKDSMSGTFNDISVPPTLVSFGVNVAKYTDIVTPELKNPGNVLVKFTINKDKYDLPEYSSLKDMYQEITRLIKEKTIISAYAISYGGIAEAVSKMSFGNKLGVTIDENIDREELFAPEYGSIIGEIKKEDLEKIHTEYKVIGHITSEDVLLYGNMVVTMEEALNAWSTTLEEVYPTKSGTEVKTFATKIYDKKDVYIGKKKYGKPNVFIPVFPGTNCEYDSARAFEMAGANVTTTVFKNIQEADIKESVETFVKEINKAQILMFPGGFSAGDEPDGSGKFIATAFRNERIKEAVNRLLKERDGLCLGICNGFQALIKLGLLPYGEITPMKEDSPTLTTNTIGRHVSKVVYTKVVSNQSPWLQKARLGEIYSIPVSHGEGRFVANDQWIQNLIINGQVATQYVDMNGNPSMNEEFNPNGSFYGIEGITSPDGRVFGKMAHSERSRESVSINITGNQNQYIFESGVEYYK